MQKLQGNVQYKDRKDILCSYGVMDDGTNYYFIGEPLSNGNIIASKKLVEAVDPMVAANEVGLIDPDGNILIPFENRKIKTLSDEVTDILVVERANPVTESVIDANNKKNDPSVATTIVSTQSVIKDKVNTLIGPEGRFACNNPFGEASIFDLNGNNLANGNYYSYIAYGNGKVYMTTNIENAEISEYAILPPEVQANVGEATTAEAPIDVNAVAENSEAIAESINNEMDQAAQEAVAPQEVTPEAVTPEDVVAEAQAVEAASEEVPTEEVAVETEGVAPQEVTPDAVTPEDVVAEAQAVEAASGEVPTEGVVAEATNPEEGFTPEDVNAVAVNPEAVAPQEEVAADTNVIETEGVAPQEVTPEAVTPEEVVAQAAEVPTEEVVNTEVPTEEVVAEESAPEASVDVNAAVPPVVGADIEIPAVDQAEATEEVSEEAETPEEVQEDMPMGGLTPDEIVAQAQAMDEEENTEEVVAEEEVSEEVPTVDEEITPEVEEHKMTPSEVMAQESEEETNVAEVSPEEVANVTDDIEDEKENVELNIDEDIDDDINDDIEDDIKEEVEEEREEIKKPTSLIDLVDEDYYEPKEFKADTISIEDELNEFDNSFDDMSINVPGTSMIENIKAGYEKALDDNARYRSAIQAVKKKYEDEHAENNRLRANHEKDLEIIAQYKDNQDILVTKYKELQAELRKTQKQLNGLAELNQLVEAHSESYVRTGRRSTSYDLDDIISSGRGRRAA